MTVIPGQGCMWKIATTVLSASWQLLMIILLIHTTKCTLNPVVLRQSSYLNGVVKISDHVFPYELPQIFVIHDIFFGNPSCISPKPRSRKIMFTRSFEGHCACFQTGQSYYYKCIWWYIHLLAFGKCHLINENLLRSIIPWNTHNKIMSDCT